jgi:alanyl-tRNA synthetase
MKMLTDKQLKEKYKPKFWKDPDKYFATAVLKKEGFTRNKCTKCKRPFWNMDKKRKVCGDPACAEGEGFSFIGKSPGKKLSYVQVWKKFSSMFKKLGYTPIKRYPVVARWNPTMEYVNASIAAFQPYVISGEAEPPANPLVIPQFCVRFGDIDNVGITQSHHTGFVMIGQHEFAKPKDWDQNKVFQHIYDWLRKGVGLPKDEITFHEDAWAGGGNLGCCMEFFSRGCELGNQVYMLYEQTPKGIKDLPIKVLDMGMGMERHAWFCQGTNTIYDAVFPGVMKKLLTATKVTIDQKLMEKYVPHAGMLNLDEVDDIDKAWKRVAKKVGISVNGLREAILPSSGVYSVAEHTRTLLFTLADGALPSNTGGGYNLRILLRRCLSFIDRYNWDVSLPEVCKWHAEELKEIFPELQQKLKQVTKILEVEKVKYDNTKQKTKSIVVHLLKSGKVTEKKLLELYDSNGIPPELVQAEAEKQGKKVSVPDNFYAMVAERHDKQEQVHATKKGDEVKAKNLPHTKAGYFAGWALSEFTAKAVHVEGNKVVLDKTLFYPTSGGQVHDEGTINKEHVVDVFKQGKVIVHVMNKPSKLKKGDAVSGTVDMERRKQLAQHHTATHVVNAATKKVLGSHINQAGAKKTVEKAHLDVTHYQSITDEEVEKIEEEANKIVKKGMKVNMSFIPRGKAEQKYGMEIYQGGAVPGKELRIVEIPGVDVECCGGTHLDNTSIIGKIKILKTTKVQDGVCRIIFTAGAKAEEEEKGEEAILQKVSKLLACEVNQLPGRAEELFTKWKKVVKKKKKIDSKKLESKEVFDGSEKEILLKLTEVFKTQPEHVIKTAERFLRELESK